MARGCGECRECCLYFPAPSVNADVSKPCQHLAQAPGLHNCMLQANKPPTCIAFKCGWLQGQGLEDDRPDKSGVLILLEGPGVSKDYAVALRTDRGAVVSRIEADLGKPLRVLEL